MKVNIKVMADDTLIKNAFVNCIGQDHRGIQPKHHSHVQLTQFSFQQSLN